MDSLEVHALELSKLMPTAANITHPKQLVVQTVQLHHRLKLVHEWRIRPSSSVIEIGCGQGDMSIVLADAVGPAGRVTGVDIGPRTYGSPFTIGDSTDHLLKSPLGDRFEFHFETDIMSQNVMPFAGSFDYAVLSHCSWYFKSPSDLMAIFRRLREFSRNLLFAEYIPYLPSDSAQYPHFAAVLIQSQLETKKVNSTSNIRTLFTPDMIRAAVVEAGWTMTREFTVATPELKDAKWEVSAVLDSKFGEEIDDLVREGRMNEKEERLIRAQIEILKDANGRVKDLQTLPSWGFLAE